LLGDGFPYRPPYAVTPESNNRVSIAYPVPPSVIAVGYEVVLADSRRVSRARRYSGVSTQRHVTVVYGTITPYGPPFQSGSTSNALDNSAMALAHHQEDPTTPNWLGTERPGIYVQLGVFNVC
jgi:hypothetical protein